MSATIRRKLAAILRGRAKLDASMQLLQIECKHPTPTRKYRGSSGNYDPSSDAYWIIWACPDCGKLWTTDQSRASIALYPNAVDVT